MNTFKDASSELNSLKRYAKSGQVIVKRVDDQLKQSTHIPSSGSSLLSLRLGEIEDALGDILRGSEHTSYPANRHAVEYHKLTSIGAMEGMYDITRLLLNSQADGSYISAWHGWNPLIYLFEGTQRFERVQPHGLLDFLDLLNHDKVHVDTEARDHTGRDTLQLAAAWYPGDIVQRVFNLGASMAPYDQEPWRMPGNPIWNALYENNISISRRFDPARQSRRPSAGAK
ncbi:hypothetical protein Daesc_003476 [Daldinia eschscholtzii]|uniref:Uncharacterized protein n=1 Tax=Daldinia eschscholtzii TaxID=292717 RepID=A0AAX6MUH8_9PEZI